MAPATIIHTSAPSSSAMCPAISRGLTLSSRTVLSSSSGVVTTQSMYRYTPMAKKLSRMMLCRPTGSAARTANSCIMSW